MEKETSAPAPAEVSVETASINNENLAGMLKFKSEDSTPTETKPVEEKKPDTKKEDEKNPSSKEWAAFTKKDKEIREEKLALKKEKEQIENERKVISDFNTKLELAKKMCPQVLNFLKNLPEHRGKHMWIG